MAVAGGCGLLRGAVSGMLEGLGFHAGRLAPARVATLRRRLVIAGLTLGLCGGIAVPSVAADAACGSDRSVLSGSAPLRAVAGHLESRQPIKLLAIGSSSTEGVGATSPDRSYPAQLQRRLQGSWSGGRIEIANAGIGGETADETLSRLERLLVGAGKPDLVLWQVGTNDALRGGDEGRFRALLKRGLDIARRAGVELVLVDQQFFPKIADPARYERYVGLVASAGAEAGVPVFSRYALMKRWAAEDPALLLSMLAADRFHMSDRGYGCLAEALGRSVIDLVAKTPSPAVAGTRLKPVLASVNGG